MMKWEVSEASLAEGGGFLPQAKRRREFFPWYACYNSLSPRFRWDSSLKEGAYARIRIVYCRGGRPRPPENKKPRGISSRLLIIKQRFQIDHYFAHFHI